MKDATKAVEVIILDERANDFGNRGSEMAAGYDLVACISGPISVRRGDRATMIPTGVACFINDPNVACLILPRSGLGHKQGLVLGNTVGLVDADYQNQWFVSVWNRGQQDEIIIHPGDRIAQALFIPVVHPEFNIVEEFSAETKRGLGGFGSTGIGQATAHTLQ
jgi:dUTP pyrophosphatase